MYYFLYLILLILNIFLFFRYVQEGIEVDYEDDCDDDGLGSPQSIVSLLDRGNSQSATMLRTSQSDLNSNRQIERKGILWLLDEETVCPGGSDESFLERLFSHYGDRGDYFDSISLAGCLEIYNNLQSIYITDS